MDQSIAIIGVPFDDNSSYLKGAALAPDAIRSAFHSASANYFAESGRDLGSQSGYFEGEDLKVVNYLEDIENGVNQLLDDEHKVISLGGDHSITYPILRAYRKRYPDLHLLQIDAHPDLYPEYEGNRHSHACPFARILEENLANSLTQVGIRTMTTTQRDIAARYGVKVCSMDQWLSDPNLNLQGPLYLSLDLDALDPAYAPGVSHLEPGGLSTRDILEIIHQIKVPLVGADIVELNPSRDQGGVTAIVAAKLLKEILDKMLL